MKHTDVRLRSLLTCDDCDEAIESIESDYLNIVGGLRAWNSGYETHLVLGAKRKIEAIDRRCERLHSTTTADFDYDVEPYPYIED